MVSRPSVNLNSDMIADESELGSYAPQAIKHSEYDYEVESSECVLRKDDLEQLNDFERPTQTPTVTTLGSLLVSLHKFQKLKLYPLV